MQPTDILKFWFAGSERDASAAAARMGFWFSATADTDASIKTQFGEVIDRAAKGDCADWAATPSGCLALILILDQFPRNVYRGTPAAFTHDALALGLTVIGQRMGFLQELSPVEQMFFLMPYQHVEDAQRQLEGVALYQQLAAGASAEWQQFLSESLDFAQLHCNLIQRFGRFPHRNSILGRASTHSELEYLRDGESFGQT